MAVSNAQNEAALIHEVTKMLDLWHFAASADGRVWIQPRKPHVKLEEFISLMKRMCPVFRNGGFKTVVFNFEGIDVPPAAWSIVLRLLAAFAKMADADCTLVRKVTQSPTAFDKRDRSSETAQNAGIPFIRLGRNSVVIVSRATHMRETEP